ncbi:MAG: hypothetical protein AB7E29_07215 [Xanthobacter sp.]
MSLISFHVSPVEFRKLFTAALGAILATIKKDAENDCQALRVE